MVLVWLEIMQLNFKFSLFYGVKSKMAFVGTQTNPNLVSIPMMWGLLHESFSPDYLGFLDQDLSAIQLCPTFYSLLHFWEYMLHHFFNTCSSFLYLFAVDYIILFCYTCVFLGVHFTLTNHSTKALLHLLSDRCRMKKEK